MHDKHFASGTKDEVWLAEVGTKGWIVLTKDDRIRYHPLERQALIENDVGAIILPRGNLKAEDMAKIFITALPAIKRIALRESRPFIYRVSASGALTKIVVRR